MGGFSIFQTFGLTEVQNFFYFNDLSMINVMLAARRVRRGDQPVCGEQDYQITLTVCHQSGQDTRQERPRDAR